MTPSGLTCGGGVSKLCLLEGSVGLNPGSTKNGDGRTVYLSTELQAVLEEQLRTQPRNCVWVFHRAGERIRDFRAAWDTACKAAGLTGRIPHTIFAAPLSAT
jgi:hypothetical protein